MLIINDDGVLNKSENYSISHKGIFIVPKHTKGIGKNTFKDNQRLRGIIFNDDIEFIADDAFYNCKRLKEITLPASTGYVGNNAFSNCENLEIATIYNSTIIAENAFNGCNKLNIIVLNADNENTSQKQDDDYISKI